MISGNPEPSEKNNSVDVTPENRESNEIPVHSYPLPVEYDQIVNDPEVHEQAHASVKYAVDIICPPGTPVFASKPGKVLLINTSSDVAWTLEKEQKYKEELSREDFERKGMEITNHVMILHSDNSISYYAHLGKNSSNLKSGDTVLDGQKIAETGLSGVMTSPHLHFHIIKGNSEDPTIAEPVPFTLINPETKEIIHESIPDVIQKNVDRFNQLITNVLSGQPDSMKPQTGSSATEMLTTVIEGINTFAPVSLSVGVISDGQPFNVAVINDSAQNTQTLQITLGENFSFAYLPRLIARIENQHADMTLRNSDQSIDVKPLLLDQLKKTTAFYLYFGQKIAELAQQNPDWNQAMTESLEVYSQVCFTIGHIFAQSTPGDTQADVSNPSGYFDIDQNTTKWLKEVCWPQTKKTIEKTFTQLQTKENFSWEAFFKQFDQEVATMLTSELNTSFESIFAERARKEFLRQTKTLKTLQETSGVFAFEQSIGGPFPKEWQELTTLKSAYATATNAGDVEVLSRIEKKIADTLSAVVFASGFWSLDEDTTSLSETATNQKINSANQAEILHQAMQHFLGIETWAAVTNDQFLSVLPLSDGRMLALGSPPYLLGNAKKTTQPQTVPETGSSWLVLSEHDRLYEASHWNVAALDFQAKSQWAEAERCYQKSLELVPQDPIIHNNLGVVLYQQKKLDESRKHLETALKTEPDNPLFLNTYGHYLRRVGQTQAALEYFKIATFAAPNDALLKSDYAHILNMTGQPQDALREWEEAANLAPNDLDLVLTYSDALQKHGRYQEAADIIKQQLTTAQPEQKSELHMEYGLVLEILGDSVMARREYETSLSLDPKNVYLWDRLHLLLEKNAPFADTENAYLRAIEIFPDHADLVNNYAAYLKKNDLDDEAENYFEEAIRMQPMNAIYRNNYALLLQKKQRHDDAGTQHEQALALDPDNPDFARSAAKFFEQQGNLERAEQLYKAAAEFVPEQFGYLNTYVVFLEKNKRFTEAQSVYDTWLEKFPNNPDLLNNRAVSLFQSGEFEQAYLAGRKTLAVQPNNPVYADNLCSFILEGDIGTAAKKFASLQEKYPDNVVIDNCASLVPLFAGEFKTGEKIVQNLLKKYPNNAYSLMTAANFYDRGEFTEFLNALPEQTQATYYKQYKNSQKALDLYTQAIASAKKTPKQIPINYREIESRIDQLEIELKKQS